MALRLLAQAVTNSPAPGTDGAVLALVGTLGVAFLGFLGIVVTALINRRPPATPPAAPPRTTDEPTTHALSRELVEFSRTVIEERDGFERLALMWRDRALAAGWAATADQPDLQEPQP